MENDKLSLHISNTGTVFDSNIPCIKTCFYFDPIHKLETVVESMQNEEQRRLWDTFIESTIVMEKSDTGRMQVVQTKFKTMSSLEPREFTEKKLYFCHKSDPEDII